LSFGTESPVIWVERPPLGACTASALVIFPPLTVTLTWTGPYSVWTALPVSTWAPVSCALPAWSRADCRDSL
jgi:hypothetical protein